MVTKSVILKFIKKKEEKKKNFYITKVLQKEVKVVHETNSETVAGLTRRTLPEKTEEHTFKYFELCWVN